MNRHRKRKYLRKFKWLKWFAEAKSPAIGRSGFLPRLEKSPMTERSSALLTDLYQINMMQAYLDHGETEAAVFELFVRNLPARRGFLIAAGLEQALSYLESLQFSGAEIEWLKSSGRFGANLI